MEEEKLVVHKFIIEEKMLPKPWQRILKGHKKPGPKKKNQEKRDPIIVHKDPILNKLFQVED